MMYKILKITILYFMIAFVAEAFDLSGFVTSRANAGIFPDNNPFSVPASHKNRYRKAGKRRFTQRNLRSSRKYIKIVNSIKSILKAKRKDNSYSVILTNWQVGEQIAKVTSEKESSRKFNEKLFMLLAIDCKHNLSELYDSVKFYRMFPILSELSQSLSWGHYRVLIKVSDSNKRATLHKESVDKKYSIEELRKRIKK